MVRFLLGLFFGAGAKALELSAHWDMDCCNEAGIVCSAQTGICEAFMHAVFSATPADVTHYLSGGARYALDGGAWHDGSAIVFENHLVKGTCNGSNCTDLGASQMFNWPFSATINSNSTMPSRICVAPWIIDTDHRDNVDVNGSRAEAVVTLPVRCFDFGTPVVVRNNQVPDTSIITHYNAFSSAATRICSDARALCRTNLHVVFTAAKKTDLLHAGGDVSFDGGLTWSSAGARAFYEQHIDVNATDHVAYQSLQFDYDMLEPADKYLNQHVSKPDSICFRVWVQDPRTSLVAWLTQSMCLKVCTELTYFHNPAGYCPSSASDPVGELLMV